MKSIKNNRPVIVGIFVFLGLAILIITVFTLGNQKKTFVKAFAVNAVFNDVGGLQEGSNVWFSGVKVGVVKKISFYGNFQVLVTMNLEKNAASHVHKDAKAKIGSDGLIGNKIVIIYGGGAATASVTKGDFLKVEKALSTEDMLVTLQANNKNLLVITNSFKSIANKIDSGGGTIGTLLNDASLSNKLKVTVNNLRATTANFEAASLNSKKVVSDIQAFTSKLNTPGSLTNEVVTDTTIFNNLKKVDKTLECLGSIYKMKRDPDSLSPLSPKDYACKRLKDVYNQIFHPESKKAAKESQGDKPEKVSHK